MIDEQLVLIEWEDSHTEGGWQPLDGEIEDRALVCRSVGWLVLDGANAKVIAPHIHQKKSGEIEQGSGIMTIPTRAVLRMRSLTLGAKRHETWCPGPPDHRGDCEHDIGSAL